MDSESKSNCHSCPIHSSCQPAEQQADPNDDGKKLSGWPLVGQAAAYFLFPLAAAIAGAAAGKSENSRILLGVSAFVLALATAAIIGLWVRRRQKVT